MDIDLQGFLQGLPFEIFKPVIIERCKSKNACEREFKKILKAESTYEIWLVILSNCSWALSNNIIDAIPERFIFPKTFYGYIDFSFCGTLSGITFPEIMSGYLDLTACNLTEVNKLPKEIGGYLFLNMSKYDSKKLGLVDLNCKIIR